VWSVSFIQAVRRTGTSVALQYSNRSYIAHETAFCRKPPIHSFTGDRKTWQILNRPALKLVMFLRKYKEKQFFVHNILTEGVFYPNCLIMREFQFDELCRLRQTTVSRVICISDASYVVLCFTELQNKSHISF
jgi:hypothetical protein